MLIEDGKQVATRRLLDVSHIAVLGNVDVGSALLRDCFDAAIAVLWFTHGGWFAGVAQGRPPKNVAVRMRQHRAAAIGAAPIARAFVSGKIRNQRTLLRRHGGDEARRRSRSSRHWRAGRARTAALPSLLGVEGSRRESTSAASPACCARRPARPRSDVCWPQSAAGPTDPVNACCRSSTRCSSRTARSRRSLRASTRIFGLYHQPRFGRPALALDLAEELRPLVGDSVALTIVNNGELSAGDFVARAGGVALTTAGRRRVDRRLRAADANRAHPSAVSLSRLVSAYA